MVRENIKVYKSSFTPMYTALGENRQPSTMKLVTLGEDEKSLVFFTVLGMVLMR